MSRERQGSGGSKDQRPPFEPQAVTQGADREVDARLEEISNRIIRTYFEFVSDSATHINTENLVIEMRIALSHCWVALRRSPGSLLSQDELTEARRQPKLANLVTFEERQDKNGRRIEITRAGGRKGKKNKVICSLAENGMKVEYI